MELIIPKEQLIEQMKDKVTKEVEQALMQAGQKIKIQEIHWVAEGLKIVYS